MRERRRREKENETKTYEVIVPKMRRWRLRPEEATVIKFALEEFDASAFNAMERVKKSLIHRMRGDYFLVLYAPGKGTSVEVKNGEAQNEPAKDQPKTPTEN